MPAAPGGNPDVLARMLAQKLHLALDPSMLMDNQPGTGGIPAAMGITKKAPDGFTLFFGDSGAMAIGPAINPKLAYHYDHFVKDDLQRFAAAVKAAGIKSE